MLSGVLEPRADRNLAASRALNAQGKIKPRRPGVRRKLCEIPSGNAEKGSELGSLPPLKVSRKCVRAVLHALYLANG